MPSQKRKNDFCSFPRQPFNITVIQVYAPTSNAEEAEVEWFYEDLQDFLELTPIKDVFFIIGDWNTKEGSQELSGVTGKFGLGVQNEVGQRLTVLPRECTGHSKHPLPTTQEKTLHMDITRWSVQKIRLIIFFAAKDGEALYSEQKQDWELTVSQIMNSLFAKFRLKLKKVGKTTRPFRYDLNQILYDYTVEVTNRFKGLDLIECLKNYGLRFMTLYRRQ